MGDQTTREKAERLLALIERRANMQSPLTGSQSLYVAQQYPGLPHPDKIDYAISEFELIFDNLPEICAEALEAAALRERVRELEAAALWALGHDPEGLPEFTPRGPGDPAYWWRKQFRALAFPAGTDAALRAEDGGAAMTDSGEDVVARLEHTAESSFILTVKQRELMREAASELTRLRAALSAAVDARTPAPAVERMAEALRAAKKEMWLDARREWTMEDFLGWALIQQIDAALADYDAGRGKGG